MSLINFDWWSFRLKYLYYIYIHIYIYIILYINESKTIIKFHIFLVKLSPPLVSMDSIGINSIMSYVIPKKNSTIMTFSCTKNMFLFICLPIYFVLFVDNLLWKSWSVPKLGWGCIIEFKNKNKVEEKLNGKEDAMKGHWGIYHRQFNMCLSRKVSVWCVPPQYFYRKIVEVGVNKDLKEGYQKEGLNVNGFLVTNTFMRR